MNGAAQLPVTVVICSIDAAKFARVTENYRALFGARELEIIGIHDARSLADGYNRGIAQSRGENIILSHDDIEILTPDSPTARTPPAQFDLTRSRYHSSLPANGKLRATPCSC
jgi:hypothetical protein